MRVEQGFSTWTGIPNQNKSQKGNSNLLIYVITHEFNPLVTRITSVSRKESWDVFKRKNIVYYWRVTWYWKGHCFESSNRWRQHCDRSQNNRKASESTLQQLFIIYYFLCSYLELFIQRQKKLNWQEAKL